MLPLPINMKLVFVQVWQRSCLLMIELQSTHKAPLRKPRAPRLKATMKWSLKEHVHHVIHCCVSTTNIIFVWLLSAVTSKDYSRLGLIAAQYNVLLRKKLTAATDIASYGHLPVDYLRSLKVQHWLKVKFLVQVVCASHYPLIKPLPAAPGWLIGTNVERCFFLKMVDTEAYLNVTTILVGLVTLAVIALYMSTQRPAGAPPGPTAFPILGNITSKHNY